MKYFIWILLFTPVMADYEPIKDWDEPLICPDGKGDQIRLLWKNFLTFDEEGRLVFLKIDKGLHTVKSLRDCLPESHERIGSLANWTSTNEGLR